MTLKASSCSNTLKRLSPLYLLLIAATALAENENNPLSQSLQQSKQQLDSLQQARQQQWLSQHRFQANPTAAQEGDLSQLCLPYNGLKFAGFSRIDPTPFAPMRYECLNEIRLNKLRQQIAQAYLDQGYIHNPLQFEDDHSGELTLRVTEGYIAKVSSESKRVNLRYILPNALLPNEQPKPLNVADLDQALDQANRVTGNNVSVDVLPAQNGEIELLFSNQERSPVAGYIGLDNNASQTYHRWQAKTGISIGNPFGLSDTLFFSANHSLYSSTTFTRSALLYYSLPYGYWTFNGFLSASQFKTPIKLEQSRFEQTGRTIQAGLSADYVIHRGANHITTFSSQIEQIESKYRFVGVMLDLQSPLLTSVQLGFNHLQLFENSHLAFDFRHEQGWNKRKNQPDNKFSKWNLDVQFSRYQQIGAQLFQHKHQLTGQYSLNYLPSVKQDDLIGRYRVRGFNDFSRAAERNAVLQNSLAWLVQKGNWQISPYLGFDLGVQKATTPDAHTEKALGYVLGVNLNSPFWSATAEWGTGRLYTATESVLQERSFFISAQYKF